MKTRILVVAPYPIKKSMHGGQKRVQALVARYRELSDEVSFVAVYLGKSHKEAFKSDIAISDSSIYERLALNPELTDIITGTALVEVADVKNKFISILKRKRPQVIHVEQPYMVEPVTTILKEIDMKCLIIFGSQNVEFEMKRSIYKTQLTKHDLNNLTKATKRIEERAVEIADIVIAVSTYDLGVLVQSYKYKPRFVIPNGIERPSENVSKSNYWATYKLDNKIEHLVTFIGSAHPPNYLGFTALLANIQTSPSVRMVIAGGVSSLVKPKDSTQQNRLILAGELSSSSLRALLYESEIILLPILNGGGSNLKTAEAIISRKKIVATKYAFRGYEKYLTLPNIYIANSPKGFEAALNKAIDESYIRLSPEQNELTETVTWSHTLIKMKYVLFTGGLLRILRRLRF